jgi:hypothetical protein
MRGVADNGGVTMRQPCQAGQELPGYRIGDWLLLRLNLARRHFWADWQGAYHVALVAVARESGTKVFTGQQLGAQGASARLAAGASEGYRLPVTAPPEKAVLLVLAGSSPFSGPELRRELDRVVGDVQPGERINTALTSFQDRYPLTLSHTFQVLPPEKACP